MFPNLAKYISPFRPSSRTFCPCPPKPSWHSALRGVYVVGCRSHTYLALSDTGKGWATGSSYHGPCKYPEPPWCVFRSGHATTRTEKTTILQARLGGQSTQGRSGGPPMYLGQKRAAHILIPASITNYKRKHVRPRRCLACIGIAGMQRAAW